MQEGKYLWLAITRDAWGEHPMVFVAGADIDKKALARRFSLPDPPGNGESLDTLRLGPLSALQDLSVGQTDLERELQRRYRGGS